MNNNPLDTIVAIHNLVQRGTPKDICDIIASFGIPTMICEKCGTTIKDATLKKSVAWSYTGDKVSCIKCQPTLSEIYKLRRIIYDTLNQS